MDNETRERFERIEADLAETASILRTVAASHQKAAERAERIERHLEVLIHVADGLIRDRRFKELEERVQALEEHGGQAA